MYDMYAWAGSATTFFLSIGPWQTHVVVLYERGVVDIVLVCGQRLCHTAQAFQSRWMPVLQHVGATPVSPFWAHHKMHQLASSLLLTFAVEPEAAVAPKKKHVSSIGVDCSSGSRVSGLRHGPRNEAQSARATF